MNTRTVGLTSRTPSFKFGMKYAISLPASVSTDITAPSWSNCSPDFCITICSTPTVRKISMVRWLISAARGWMAVPR